MTVQMDEKFAEALHDLLVEQVRRGAGARRLRLTRPKRWLAGAGVVLVLAAGGGGISYATGAWTMQPGSNVVTPLAGLVTVTGSGTQTVDLGPQPAGTDAINISFICLTAGDFRFADGAGIDCDSASVADLESHPSTYTMSIAPGQDSTTITAPSGARWRLTATYSSVTTTPWGVNASGQTYGTPNQHGTPDLVGVMATNHRSGYAYANQLMWRSGTPPTTPSQAAAESNAQPWTVTVYESDGKTPIGKLIVGG